jgi:3-hydroxypropionyl-CoA synthetase (ADP-forming)
MTEATLRWMHRLDVPGRPDEGETKALLSGHGLRVPRAVRVKPHGQDGALPAADLGPDFAPPCIVKVLSPDILHKTEQGGILLSVGLPELPAAIERMGQRFPGCSVLVEEQVRFEGNEFIVGAFIDPSFGPAVMAGAGGILTELYQDVAFRLVPCSAREARRMLEELRVFPVLAGFRGLRADAAGLAEAIARVSDVVEELGERFVGLDINPVVCAAEGWTVLDAKLVLAPEPVNDRPA